MDDPHKSLPQTSEIKNILPDVVHSQQIPTVESVSSEQNTGLQTRENIAEDAISHDVDDSKTESISEHIPSKIEYSTDSDNATKPQALLKIETEQEKVSKYSSLNIPQLPHSPTSDHPSTHDASKGSSSLPLDVNAISDIHLLSEESPVNLALLSDLSKETQEKSHLSDGREKHENTDHDTPDLSARSDKYLDSLNEESSQSSDLSIHNSDENSDKIDSPDKVSSGSEEIIKLDIRGQGAPKFPFPAAKIIFGPPPEGATLIEPNVEQMPVFPNLLSPFLVGAGDSVKVEELFDDQEQFKRPSPEPLVQSPDKSSLSSEKSLQMSPDKQSFSSDKIEADLLIEEITVEDEIKEKCDKPEETSMPKSMPAEETMSFSTMTTDYKTICEEYHVKLVHLEAAITQRDDLIEELTVSLQRSVRERDDLRYENEHLTNEVSNLQHMVAERSHSENDTVKGQLSDFMKYQSMIKDDSTKFYSAVMSGGSSMQSSNGEKDMDREEIVINYSKSDLRSSDVSDEFQTGFETKLTTIINKFKGYLEENLRNKLRESLIQVLCDEIAKMRLDNDTEVKELEAQMQQEKQVYSTETRRLRELLASVKAGNVDIEALRQELDFKHEKEMENLRTYFEKKCSDMERSYSEEVWRGKCASPAGSATSLDAEAAGAGDCARRRTRSAEFPSLSLESTQVEQALKQACKKYEQQIDELKAEHVAYVNELQVTHREAIAALDEQITQLKAHIQTTENTETNVSLYQQDIDLELEKKMEVQLEERLEEVREEVRQEVVTHLQEQLQVLLSDPDAEVSSWPLELVALRDKIHGDAVKAQQEKECSSLRDELSVGEDKWKQRRNISFDQNRQLEEVTRERDDLKRVAVSLHRVVGQLVAYCACAEDELNRTVLTQLLARLLPEGEETIVEDESRPTTPNLSGDLNTSVVSRTGKHVHFAPDLNVILSDLDEEGIVNFLQQQRDLSADIKKELEHSLRRLRHEAHSLLDLSDKLAKPRSEYKMLESSQVQITELVEDLESRQKSCDNCELHRKNMEEAMAECLQRENLLRSDLEAAMIKIAQLMTSADVIAEGYGTCPALGAACGRSRPSPGGALSLDGTSSPRTLRLAHDIESLQRERDDLHQQVRRTHCIAYLLDGASSPRTLRLAHDIESLQRERDDLHQQVRRTHCIAYLLDGASSPRTLRLAHDIESLQRERDDLHQQVRRTHCIAYLLDGASSPRTLRLAHDIESLQRERDDLHQQVRRTHCIAYLLDGASSPRTLRLAHDIESLQRERDDLHQQVRRTHCIAYLLDGASSPRTLRLAHDIESLQRERDDLHQQVRRTHCIAYLLDGASSPRTLRLAHDIESLQRERDDLHHQVRRTHCIAYLLDGASSPRTLRLAHDIESLQRERDDLHQQVRRTHCIAYLLDGASSPRTLRLAHDIESLQRERDDLHQQVRRTHCIAYLLDGASSPRTLRLAHDIESLQRERDDLHQQVRRTHCIAYLLDGASSPRTLRLAHDIESLQRERDDLHQQVRRTHCIAYLLDGASSPRTLRLAHDIESLQRERDDLHQQVRRTHCIAYLLDGASSPRTLRLAHDIESLQRERDDLHQQVRRTHCIAYLLDGASSPRTLRLAHDIESLQRERDDLHQQVRRTHCIAYLLDGASSPRTLRLAHDIESLQRERDDLHQQVRRTHCIAYLLDGASSPRTLRLAHDIESLQRERDDLHQQVRRTHCIAYLLDGASSPRTLRLAHDIESLQRERDDLHQQVRRTHCIAYLLDGASSPRTLRLAHDIESLQRERDDLHQQVRRTHCIAYLLDGASSPRTLRLAHDIESLQRERDDLHQQLEAANRQLRSTRQFVEEQAHEREAERDEFARRLADLRDDNARLATRLQNNARILNEVEQLETQTREMNQIITELESRKASTDEELKASEEKITLLRDIIANLESQLEQKTTHEAEILEQLEQMKKTIDDRDRKMRTLLGELESLKSERVDQSDVTCVKCGQEEEKIAELLDRVKEQCRYLEEQIHRRTRKLERVHEVCSTSCSEPSEDVSLRDQRDTHLEVKSPDPEPSARMPAQLAELCGVWECLRAHARAEDAALKRVADLEMQRAQLKDIAQEVRAERDVLQARMSEQALKISSLSARLQQQRNDAEALSHQATSQLSVQLHDALAEVQRLKEELESKDKQLNRVKQNLEERDKLHDEHHSLYGNSCNPKDKVIILERELSNAQTRIAQLECLAKTLEKDKDELQTSIRDLQRGLAEKEDQLQELLALKLEEENQKEERNDALEGKASARTLSDIVSISEFDEQDLQMRRAELKGQNISLTGAPYPEIKERTLNRTLPPEFDKANMSSLNIEFVDHFDLPGYTPRADSLPAHLTSTQNKEFLKDYKRNVNETTVFGIDVRNAQNIPDNCSLYPNRDVNDSKDISVEPKKINFSLEMTDNKTHDEFTSLRELGIALDVKQENFPDILTQLKHEIKKSRTELENAKSQLKNAEEQLCEFPALKEEVEELKSLLENTMATMATDKKFYENQLENFTSNKKLLEQRLTELTQEVNDKSKDLHLLKEDILRRENMILELAKEKRNLTNKMTELEVKIDELQSRNNALEKYESENHQMREKLNELQKLQQLVSEKNQQIDSLNQHLDRLDDLQRNLSDKTEELDNLKEALEEKSNEVFHLQDTVEALNRDLAKANEENDKLNTQTKDLKMKLTKLEKEQENASLKLQSNECELERVNSLNSELAAKIDELKLLTDKLKDKETEIEILHEDINAFHEELASLKEQLKMVSRSPSPRSKNGEERKSVDRQASSDKKQLVKIRKQISLLQHELDFNKKELNDKAFELAKAKLDVTELKSNLSQANKQVADKDLDYAELRQQAEQLQREMQQLMEEKEQLGQQLETVVARMREESNVGELKNKLRHQVERCQELEIELENLRELVDRARVSPARTELSPQQRALATRSPTAELERALRDQLDYSHTLDEDIMEQILSASSDEREDIPRLALNTSKSSSSIHSSSSDRINRLRSDNDKLQMQVNNLESRLKDKDALITELNRIRDKLVSDWQTCKLRYEAERDNSGRLQLLLDTHKETSESLQNQDSNMIQILKKRLESAMASELELQQREQQSRARLAQLERQLLDSSGNNNQHDPLRAQLNLQMETSERLKGEVSILKSKLEVERSRYQDLQATLEHARAHAQRELDARNEHCSALRSQLAEIKRLKHDTGVQLLRAKELIGTQNSTIAELEAKLASVATHRPVNDALTEIESTKTELARELATFKKCLLDTASPELMTLRLEKQQLTAKVDKLEKEVQALAKVQPQPDERDQAIRYLHGRCLRLESCRKALVWQKRYLQRVQAGYTELEKNLRLPSSRAPEVSRGKKRFKCIAAAVVAALRMGYLVRRRLHARALAAPCVLRAAGRTSPTTQTPYGGGYGAYASGTSPPSRDVSAPAPVTSRSAAASLARRAMKQDLRLNLPSSPGLGDFVRRSPYTANSPREDPFILSSPRGEVAAAYLNKLELVSRCLNHAMDSARDVP